MALSNILREPRREITETLMGLAILAVPIWLDYRFAIWFEITTGATNPRDPCPWPVGMIFGAIFAAVLVAVLFVIHALGNVTCNTLEAHGVQVRPRQRWN
jgi:hypothetical protein